MKKLLLFTLLVLPALMASAQKNTPRSYIDQFKDEAVRIMHETGVPASIVLGIAMHESACGNSVLARNLNNQFGVRGDARTYYYRHHKKVSTSYKRYASVYDSFQDFARIMTGRAGFSDLAEKLTHFDYKGWARGIQKSGYAHDRRWGARVLALIRYYRLYQFDENPDDADQQLAQNSPAGLQ